MELVAPAAAPSTPVLGSSAVLAAMVLRGMGLTEVQAPAAAVQAQQETAATVRMEAMRRIMAMAPVWVVPQTAAPEASDSITVLPDRSRVVVAVVATRLVEVR